MADTARLGAGDGPWAGLRGSFGRRLYILPTARGLAFAVALLGMLVGAINYGANLGHLLVFLLGGVGLASAVHTHRNLLGVTVRGGRVAPVFAGDDAVFPITLEDPAGADHPGLALSFRGPVAGGHRVRWREVEVSLPPGEAASAEIRIGGTRRGRLELGRLQVSTRFPLGLFRAWAPVDLGLGVLVYPRPAGALPLPRPVGTDGAEAETGDEGPAEEDFAGLRDYAQGDSPRRIHWKAAARGQAVPVKVFSGPASDELRLRWAEAGPGDDERRLSQLARWLVDAEAQGLRYALDLPGDAVPAGRGDDHLHRCLARLALYPGMTGA